MLIMQISIMFPPNIVTLIIEILQRVMYEERLRHGQKIMKKEGSKISKHDVNDSCFSKPSDLMNKIMHFLAIHLLHEKVRNSVDSVSSIDIIEKLMQNQIFSHSYIRQTYITEVIKMRDYWQLAEVFERKNIEIFRHDRIRYVFKAQCMVSSMKSRGSFGTRLIMLSPQSLFIFDLEKMDQIIDEIQQIYERNAAHKEEPKDTEENFVRPEDRLEKSTAE